MGVSQPSLTRWITLYQQNQYDTDTDGVNWKERANELEKQLAYEKEVNEILKKAHAFWVTEKL